MKKFDVVGKIYYETDKYNAPYETIEAETRGKAKYKYMKMYPECKYTEILCRTSRKGSFNI